MADAEFDVSASTFQDEFTKLSESGSNPNDLAAFAPERENMDLTFKR